MRSFIAALSVLVVALVALLVWANRPLDKLPSGSKADRIVVEKSSHTLTLYASGRPLKVYTVALGRGAGAAKQREGDHETPEGLYVIDARNPRSRFHLALHVSYPNALDSAHAASLGVPAGGAIMIHGVGRGLGWLGRLQPQIDWTDGCIALTNPEMDEVWKLVPTGTPIEIRH
ncbi:MAG TPA: L,D-transpeptidase family protein [Acidobacteriaceae bacterium]|nr:L,D-transpeptidase family protein [Acidobacteriaceae bacterium]